jgi:hypothetical protein
MAETHVIEVRAGRGEPPSLELRPGLELAPLSVGTGGAWKVEAPGVRAVHFYLYFDGQTLFLQSAAADDPPLIDGKPVPAAWTPAPDPCTVTFGQARLAFHPTDNSDQAMEDERTIATALPDDFRHDAPLAPTPAKLPARPFKPGAFVPGADDESTRLQPLEDFAGPVSEDSTRVAPLLTAEAPGVRGLVRPAAGASWNQPPPPPAMPPPPAQGGFQSRQFPPPPPSAQPDSGPVGPPGPPSGLLNVPPPSGRKPDAPETFPETVKRQWAAAPPIRRALFVAMPVALLVAVWLFLNGSDTPPLPKVAAAVPSQSAAASTSPPPSTGDPPPDYPPPPPPPPHPPPPPASGKTTAAAGNAPPPPSPATGDAAAPNSDHRERQAADFVSTHAYDQAIRLYDQLAAEHPDKAAFKEAARILRGKLATGTP